MLVLMRPVLGYRSHNHLHNPPPGWSWDAQWPRGCAPAREAQMLCSSCRPEGDLWPRTHSDTYQTSKKKNSFQAWTVVVILCEPQGWFNLPERNLRPEWPLRYQEQLSGSSIGQGVLEIVLTVIPPSGGSNFACPRSKAAKRWSSYDQELIDQT